MPTLYINQNVSPAVFRQIVIDVDEAMMTEPGLGSVEIERDSCTWMDGDSLDHLVLFRMVQGIIREAGE